jgi:hypothetical protein
MGTLNGDGHGESANRVKLQGRSNKYLKALYKEESPDFWSCKSCKNSRGKDLSVFTLSFKGFHASRPDHARVVLLFPQEFQKNKRR